MAEVSINFAQGSWKVAQGMERWQEVSAKLWEFFERSSESSARSVKVLCKVSRSFRIAVGIFLQNIGRFCKVSKSIAQGE